MRRRLEDSGLPGRSSLVCRRRRNRCSRHTPCRCSSKCRDRRHTHSGFPPRRSSGRRRNRRTPRASRSGRRAARSAPGNPPRRPGCKSLRHRQPGARSGRSSLLGANRSRRSPRRIGRPPGWRRGKSFVSRLTPLRQLGRVAMRENRSPCKHGDTRARQPGFTASVITAPRRLTCPRRRDRVFGTRGTSSPLEIAGAFGAISRILPLA
jgi:hypothetical protein